MAKIRELIKSIKEQDKSGDKMTLKEYISYAVANFGFGTLGVMSGGYLMLFYTAIGIDVAAAGSIVAATKIWDSVNDPICATIIDNCNSSKGKFKRFLTPLVPFLSILSVLMFIDPPTSSSSIKIVICSTVYVIWETINTFVSISFQSMQAVISRDLQERSNYITFANLGGKLSGAIPGLIPVLFDIATKHMAQSTFYTLCAVFFGALGCAGAMFSVNLKERIITPHKKQHFYHNFVTFFKNKQMILLWSANLSNIISSVGWTASSFFFIYSIGKYSVQTLVWTICGTPTFIVMMLAPIFLKHFKPRKIVIFNNLLGAACMAIMYVAGMAVGYASIAGIVIIIVMNFISSIPSGVSGIAANICSINTFDYTEWKTGDRAEATTYVVTGMLNKWIGALGAFIAGILLKKVGFVEADASSITQSTKDYLFLFYTIFQAVGMALSSIPYFFYKIDGKVLETVKADLDARRAAIAGGEAGESGSAEEVAEADAAVDSDTDREDSALPPQDDTDSAEDGSGDKDDE